jgi:hypothetical protein
MPNHSPIHLTRSKSPQAEVRSLLLSFAVACSCRCSFFVVILNAVKDPRILSLSLLLFVLLFVIPQRSGGVSRAQ